MAKYGLTNILSAFETDITGLICYLNVFRIGYSPFYGHT